MLQQFLSQMIYPESSIWSMFLLNVLFQYVYQSECFWAYRSSELRSMAKQTKMQHEARFFSQKYLTFGYGDKSI